MLGLAPLPCGNWCSLTLSSVMSRPDVHLSFSTWTTPQKAQGEIISQLLRQRIQRLLLVFNVSKAWGMPLTASRLSPCTKWVTSFYPVLGIFIRLWKTKLRFQNYKEKNTCKSTYDISAYYFKRMKKSANGLNITEGFLMMRELASLEMKLLAWKDKRVDCFTGSWCNDTEVGRMFFCKGHFAKDC